MKTTFIKIGGAAALLLASAGAMAATFDCCGDFACCIGNMLSCCF
jgi:hypothetical protein